MGMESWYPSLERPDLAPPNWVFGPVWTIQFALMGVGLWLVWRGPPGPDAPAARALFAGQFLLDLTWPAVFFGAQSILGGPVVIAVLWLAVLATIVAFFRVDWRPGSLLVPYPLRVSFAAYRNSGFWVPN